MARLETILALDLGTKCGFAVLRGRKVIDSGRWSLLSSRKGRHRGERWVNLRANITALVDKHQPDIVAYERVRRHVGTTAAHVYGGMLCVLEILDMEWQLNAVDVELVPIEIGTWKRLATGKGNATKTLVRSTMDRRYKIKTKSEDEADALGVALAMQKLLKQG